MNAIELFSVLNMCLILVCEMVQQWIDLARFTGLQARKSEPPSYQTPDSSNPAALESNTPEEASIDEIKNQ